MAIVVFLSNAVNFPSNPQNLPGLWEKAGLAERRNLLLAMLDAVYVDIVEEKSVVAIRLNPAFRPLLEIATTDDGSGVVLINELPPDRESPGAVTPCSWWRRARVHPPSN